jgi:hypothetical protein
MSAPVGEYKVKACAIELKESTKKKTPFVAVSFQINGMIESWSGYLSEAAAQRTIESLRYMGWQGNDLETITLADVPGWVIAAVKEEREDDKKTAKLDDDGNVLTRIAFINPLSGAFGAPMDHDARKALSLRLRGVVAAAPKCAPTLALPKDDAGEDLPPEAMMREPGSDG